MSQRLTVEVRELQRQIATLEARIAALEESATDPKATRKKEATG